MSIALPAEILRFFACATGLPVPGVSYHSGRTTITHSEGLHVHLRQVFPDRIPADIFFQKGHQDITCQGCHESIHGLYPVTSTIDTTSYAQAASLNHDGSNGPLKCGTCHQVNGAGVPGHIQDDLLYEGQPIVANYDAALSWMHALTAEADPRGDYCLNCHGDNSSEISSTNRTWTEHSFKGRSPREMMDKVELLQLGHLAGDPAVESPESTVCTSCHGDRTSSLSRRGCTDKWKNHLIQGRAAEPVWEHVSTTYAGSTCGW